MPREALVPSGFRVKNTPLLIYQRPPAQLTVPYPVFHGIWIRYSTNTTVTQTLRQPAVGIFIDEAPVRSYVSAGTKYFPTIKLVQFSYHFADATNNQ